MFLLNAYNRPSNKSKLFHFQYFLKDDLTQDNIRTLETSLDFNIYTFSLPD